jgi:hypothetical protein
MLVLRENGKAKFKIYFVCRYNLNFDTVKEADGITTPDFYLVMPAERIGLGHLKIQILVFKFEINKVWKEFNTGVVLKVI